MKGKGSFKERGKDGVVSESMEGLCFLITTSGEFMCRGANCGWGIPRGRIASTSAEIQAALHKKGVVATGNISPSLSSSCSSSSKGSTETCSHMQSPVIRSAPIGEQFKNPDHLPSCGFCGTFYKVVGCNNEGCSLGWYPSHGIYVSGVGCFWCLKHKDNIPLEHEYSITQRPLGCARTFCVTCHTE
eukprot:5988791-Amphidinium_carterae.1